MTTPDFINLRDGIVVGFSGPYAQDGRYERVGELQSDGGAERHDKVVTVSPAMVDKAYLAYTESTGHCMRERVQDALIAATDGAVVLSPEGQALIARMVGAHAAVVQYIVAGRTDLALAESRQWVEGIDAAIGDKP